jgi:hypothetical protein
MPTTPTKKFAAGTSVSPARSREEIDSMLKRFGAAGFGYAEQNQAVAIIFEISGATYRYMVNMPKLEDFRTNAAGHSLSATGQKNAWEHAVRETWRALVATIKGKLVAVDSGIETFEDVFQQYTVMPNGQTVGEYNKFQLDTMRRTGELPRMLPSGR